MSALKLLLWVPWTLKDAAFCPTSKVFSMAFLCVPRSRGQAVAFRAREVCGDNFSLQIFQHMLHIFQHISYFRMIHFFRVSIENSGYCVSIAVTSIRKICASWILMNHRISSYIICQGCLTSWATTQRKRFPFVFAVFDLNCTSCEAACRQLPGWNSKEWSLTVCILVCQEHHEIVHNNIQSCTVIYNLYVLKHSVGLQVEFDCRHCYPALCWVKSSYSAWQTPSNRTSISILMLLPRDNHRSWAALPSSSVLMSVMSWSILYVKRIPGTMGNC